MPVIDETVTIKAPLTAVFDYLVDGIIKDATTGSAIDIPVEQTITVPLRWLRPAR